MTTETIGHVVEIGTRIDGAVVPWWAYVVAYVCLGAVVAALWALACLRDRRP